MRARHRFRAPSLPRWVLVLGCVLLPLVAAAAAAADDAPARATQGKLDLNRASLEQLQSLPISAEAARAIHIYRTYVRYFDDIFDLRDVEQVTPEMLNRLKPLVAVLPPPQPDEAIARMAASYRQVRNYLGQEGSSEGLVDEYLDLLAEPANVNDLDLFDLMSFQNVSPVDAKAIIEAREKLGDLSSARQLRRSDGLRYYAYRNLRDFVVYEDDALGDQKDVRADYQLRYYDTPIYDGDDENSSDLVPRHPQLLNPAMSHKLRVDLPGDWRAGVRTYRGLGERDWSETAKGYVELKDQDLGPFHLKRAVAGSYRVAFGSGLVMDNTDFIHFRKTGYGWNKRPLGIRGDLSRSREYRLTGGAVEGRVGDTYLTLFGSSDWRDAIVNPDGTINRYIGMRPRFTESQLFGDEWYRNQSPTDPPDTTGLRRNAFRENLVGANVKQMLGPGTYLGATVLHSGYNRAFDANPGTLVSDYDDLVDGDPATTVDHWQARDSEIAAGYTTVFSDPGDSTVTEYRWRRIYGLEGQMVVGNAALQAEYAWLQDPREGFLQGEHHDAFIANASRSGTTCTCWPSGATTTSASTTRTCAPSATTPGTSRPSSTAPIACATNGTACSRARTRSPRASAVCSSTCATASAASSSSTACRSTSGNARPMAPTSGAGPPSSSTSRSSTCASGCVSASRRAPSRTTSTCAPSAAGRADCRPSSCYPTTTGCS